MTCIAKCGAELEEWNRVSFESVNHNLHLAQSKLEELQNSDPLGKRNEEYKIARKEVQTWLEREERLWHQRSWITWLSEGDKNTWFFHNKAS